MAKARRLAGRKLTTSKFLDILDSADFKGGFWKEKAECVRMMIEEPEKYKRMDWFPAQKPIRVSPKIAEVCDHCPVRLECLSFAIDGPEPTGGIWGGHTYKGVKKIRRRWKEIRR